MSSVLVQAALPTARAIRWAPSASLAAVLVAAGVLARSADRPADTVLVIAAAGLAATVVAGLHDPAAALLSAVPVPLMQRRALRLVLLGLPALAVWWLLDTLTTAGSGPGPLVALTACGVAVAVWAPPRRAVLLGASTPVALFALHQVGLPGRASDVVAWWLTDPWWVLVGAVLLCVAGRRR